jgi:NAD+ synthase
MTMMDEMLDDILLADPEREVDRICRGMVDILKNRLKRRGLVLGLSGGIDSSVTAALAVRAVGADRILGLEMPERHSARETLQLSGLVAEHFRIRTVHEDISGILEAVGFYERYDRAVQQVFPQYGQGWKSKIVIPDRLRQQRFNLFSIVAQGPDGTILKKRLPLKPYLEIVAATNFKQRTRKMLEYYHADCRHYAVAGTPNRLEYDQGFFVKLGDGAADIKPIAHLYKSQVYQLAEFLGVPEAVRTRPPTTDTYSLEQGQDEFYFSLPWQKMDICLYAKNNGIAAARVAEALQLEEEAILRVFQEIDTKRDTTHYQHTPPLLVGQVPEIGLKV